jgi:hypothetical protein
VHGAATANTTALQAALNAVATAGGGVVSVPSTLAGVLYINNTLTIGSRTIFDLNGWHLRLTFANGTSTTASPKPVIASSGNTNYIGIRNVYIDGNKANQVDTGFQSNGIDFYSRGTSEGSGAPVYDGGLWCENVMVYNCKGEGFYVRGAATTMRVTNCYSYHNDGTGFWFKTDCEASNCVAANNGGYGFFAQNGTSVRWTNLKAFGSCQRYSGADFQVSYCTTIMMSDCQAEDSGQTGFVWTSCTDVEAVNLIAYRCGGQNSDSNKSAFWIEDDGGGNLCQRFTLRGAAHCADGASVFNYALTTRNLGVGCEVSLKTVGQAVARWHDLSGSHDGIVLFDDCNRGYQTVAYAATITPDQYKGEILIVGALTGNLTIAAPAEPYVGQRLRFRFLQDATGSRTITWNGVFVTNGWTVQSAANARSAVAFLYDGSNWVAER